MGILGWFRELREEIKHEVGRGPALPYTQERPSGFGTWREVPNPPNTSPDLDPWHPGAEYRHKLTDGYEVEANGDVVRSDGIIEAFLGWFQ